MDVSFSVSMMLQSVNNMAPGIQSAQRLLQGLGQTVKGVAAMGKNSNPVQGWDDKIRKTVAEMKALQNEVEKVEKSAGKMRQNGFEQVATGVGIGLPAFDMIKKASERQVAQIVLKDAGMSLPEIDSITNRAKDLSTELMFSVNELLSIPLAMQRAGMNADKINNSFQQIAYLTELEHLRTGRGAYEIAKDLSSMAELAQVTNDQSKLTDFMETVNRIATITTANTGVLAESAKYFMPIAGIYGLSSTDAMMAQGIAARFGVEGSMAGTHLKDFLDRLNPFEHLKASGRSEALSAMEDMGFLKDAHYNYTKTGAKKFDGIGGSIFFDQNGKAMPILDIYATLASKYKEMVAADPTNGPLKFAANMKKIFGEQGKDVAMIAAQNSEQILKMKADFDRVQSIEQSVRDFQDTFKQTFAAFGTNLENIGVDAVTQTMKDLTGTVKEISPYVNGFAKWAGENKELVTTIVQATLGLSAFLIVLGTIQIVLGTIGKLMFGGLRFAMAPLQWILQFALSLMNLKTFFSVLRLEGAGFFRALWGGAQAAWPWLAKVSSWVVMFGRTFIMTALRVAAGWLIAMGPVGWAVLAVLAAVGLLFAAWETNFLGFQDMIKAGCEKVVGWLKGIVDKMLEILGLKNKVADIEKGAKEMGYNTPGGVGDISYSNDTPMVPTYGADNTPRVDGGSGSDTFSPQVTITNNVSVNSAEEAGEYVAGSVPDKYLRSRDPAFGGV